jgi:hypothetical protein
MKNLSLAVVCIAAIYGFLAFVALPQSAFFSSDEGLKFIQVQNVLRKGWSDFSLDYPGQALDTELSFVPVNNPPPLIRDGKIYSVYPVLLPVLTAPLFSALGYAGLYVIPLLAGLLTLCVTSRLARVADTEGVSSAVVLGLCTPLVFYSLLLWDHTLAVLLSAAALLLIAENLDAPRTPLIFLAGVLLGLSVWARTELYVMVLVLPLMYFVLLRRKVRPTISLVLGALLALTPLWIFQFLTYGNSAGPHIGHFASLGEELPVTTNRLAITYYTLLESNPDLRLAFLFVMAFAAAAAVVASRRLRNHLPLVAGAFGVLLVTSLLNLRSAWPGLPMGGLLATTPFLALLPASLPLSSMTRVDRLLLGVCGGYVAVVCLATPVDPGLQWGPRFLLPAYPAATVLGLKGLRKVVGEYRRPSMRLAAGACLASTLVASALLQGCGIHVLHVIKNRDRQLIESTSQLASRQIVSDEYGYAQYVAPLFYEREFFYVRTQQDYQRLVEIFFAHGINTYAVTAYSIPHRRAVDPLNVSSGLTVHKIGDQLFEIEADSRVG